jgi:hypothetical protein
MTQSQHEEIFFFLVILFACAVAGAALTVCGCGGAEFTVLEAMPDAAPRLVDRDVAELAPEIGAAEASLNIDAISMNSRDAEAVESSIDTKDAQDAEVDAKLANPDAAMCDLPACLTRCPGGKPACCNFGPSCAGI